MTYLTYQEYIDLGFPEIGESEFYKLLPKASDVIDSVTRSFYRFNDIEQDVPFRREQFKKAIAAQIQYFHDMGVTSSHELEVFETVTIGRTTISSNRGSSSNETKKNSIISIDALMYLRNAGFLYSCVGVTR